jgi:hypothetical protein
MGSFQGGGTLNSLTSFTWQGGQVNCLAAFNVQGQLVITDPGVKTLTNTTLVTTAQGVWDNGNIFLTSSTFTNYGILEIRHTQNLEVSDTRGPNPSLFRNLDGPAGHGTIFRTGNAPTTFDITLWTSGDLLLNSQTIHFTNIVHQFGANSTTNLGGGTVQVDAPYHYDLSGGTLRDGGTIQGDLAVSNFGTVIAGSDVNHLTLLVNGNYSQDVTATLRVQARSDSTWGLFVVSLNATWNGALAIDLLGGYGVNPGTTKTVLLAGQGFGSFVIPPPGWNIGGTPSAVTVTKT